MTNQQGAPEAPRGTAADGKTELFNVTGYPLMVRAVDFNRLHAENERLAALAEAQQPAPSAASKAVLAAIRAANMQLVRTGDDEFMLVTYKNAKAQCDGGKCGIGGYCDDCPTPQADSQPAPVAPNYKQALWSKNCMQCCVSYMLGLPLNSAPDFATDGGWELFSEFVDSKGYAAVMLPGNHEFEADYLASGTTARGTSHMVVMNDGKLVHDPHPSNAGLTEVRCVWLLAKKATPQRDDREDFEACAKAYTSNVSFERDGDDYEDMTASLLWHGWKLRAARAPAGSVTAPAATPTAASIAWTALRDLTDPLGEAGVKIMGHIRTYAQRQYEAGLAEGRAAPAATPQADSQPAMTPETVYAAIAHGDEEHRAWLLSALRAVWCGEAVPPVASPIADATADSVTAPAGGAVAGSGWKWVPKILSDEMVDAWASARLPGGISQMTDNEANRAVAQANWDAMIAAAPTPPAQAADSVTAPAGGAVMEPTPVTDADVRDMSARVISGQAEEDELVAFFERLVPPRPVRITHEADSVLEDAARLDWLALAGPTSICLVIDRAHDGEIEVATDDVTGYGQTLREALDAARKQGANHD